MAAGLSKKQEQQYRYRMLKRIESELKVAGVACFYMRGGKICGNGLFDIHIFRMNASNGECCLYPALYTLHYGSFTELHNTQRNFTQGIELLKKEYGHGA